MIELRHVSVIYPDADAPALDDIDLSIRDGEFVFIIGDSGAGKSTLLRLLLGEQRPSSGEILVDDRNIGALKKRELPYHRRQFGVVFQDFRLFQEETVYQNVAYAMRVLAARKRTIAKRVPMALSLVGMEGKAESYPPQLSGGEQQRTAIARAIVNGPMYLLADEPTGNLDPVNTEDVMLLLQHLAAKGTTVLVVTHDLAAVKRYGGRVLQLKDGKLVRDARIGGSHEIS